MKEEKQYPSNYSTFDPRTNATYDGDPNGDYVMAEDINQLQEGISRIEKAIGLFASEEATLVDRLKAIADKGIEEIRVPEIRLIRAGVELTDSAHTVENLSAFPLVAFSSYSLSLKPLIQKIGERNTLVYGVIDAAKPLAEIQSAVGQWQAVGATGIYLRNFGEIQTARKEENDILQSIRQVGMTLLIQSNQWTKLFGSNVVEGYNPTAEKLALASDCILLIDEFAYYDRPFFGEEMEVKMAPFLKAKKESGVQLLGNAKVTNQSIFNYSMMYGLLYSLDYFYKGDNLGEVTIEPTRYNFPQYMGEWKTENPTLFDAGDSIERTIRAGKLIVNKDLTIKFQGLSVQINDIEWLSQSVNGNVIKEGTLAPTALSTYDVDRIIKLFNSNATIKIDPKVIDTDESGGILPINIPAKNMKENVIEAINKKNDVDSTENQQVIDASIKSVSAAKVVGDYTTAQMKKNVIAAVNSSEGTINVDKASIGIVSSTEINSNLISSEQATINRANITETVTALNVDVSNLLTANKATIDYLTSLRIETEVLITDTLEVSDLKADNISAIVIEAVKAEITSGVFRDIVTEYLTADIIKTELINAVNSMIGEAVIDGAMIEEATITSAHITDLTANKITAGTLNVGVVTITGPEGHLLIKENKLVIYDKADSEGIRRKRVQLGDVSDVLGTDTYGLIVMGEDGSTVLYDHTGVYNEGIHDNAVNNDKLEDEAVDSRVIRAGSVIAKHIQGETITGDKIAANAITTNKIAAGTITAGSAIISDAAIGSAKISELHGNKIIAGTITAEQIAANSITVDKLSVGDRVNLIKNGFDSFEQFPVGHQIGEALTGAESSIVSEDMAYSGNKSLLIAGNNVKNTLLLYNKENKDRLTSLKKDQDYILSSYCMVEDSSVQVEIGIRYYENEEVINDVWSPSFIAKPGEMVRAFYKFQPTAENVDCAVMLRTNASNVNVYFDAIQIEAVESDITKPSWWVSTETTDIDGGSIKTGTIDASRIKIGQGTQFGNGDIITLSDEGISVQATNGEAHINSDGIKIVGGAFLLENEDKVIIDGQNGIAVQSPTNKISMDPDTGFAIMKRLNDEKVFYVDPDGNLFLKGRVEVTSSDSIYSKDEVDDVINQIELTPGEDGKTSHLHTAYSWSSDGTDRFTTVYPGENFLLDSQRERVGKTSEFLRVSEWDLTPVFDEYGIEKEYALSFDLKSEVAGPIVVYCQSGANTEYEIGQTIVQATTEYQRFSIKITPKHSNPEFQVSQLAFYGTYNSGRIPSVKNAKLEIGNASTVYTTNAEESFDDAYPIFSGSYTDYLETNSTKPSDYVWKRILGDGGKDGIAGNDGRGIQSTTINYAQGTSATTPPTSGWSTSVPPLVKGQYLWTQTIWMYTDGSSELGYSVSYNAKDGNTGKDGIAGKDGVGISSTLIEYASATTGTTAPTTGWQSTVPTVGEGSYLWTKTTWTYTDNTTEVGYSVAKMGVSGQDGKDGVAGKDGLGIKATTIEYAQAVSGTTPPSTGWTLEVPSLTKGQYLWTQTTWTYTDNSSETGYSVSYNAKDGNSGKDGIAGKDGVGIKTTLVQYVGSTSGTTAPTTGWATTVPTVPEGSFLWTKTTWTYTDNTTEVGYSVAKMGVSGQDGKDGIPGKDGLGIKNTLIEYAQSTSGTVSPTTGWSEQVPTLVKGQYLWTQTTWTYTDNSTEKGYSVSYNAKDGNTGSDGKPGKDGNGIVKTDIQYVGSATGTTPPTSGWTAAIPTVPEGSYLWTKTTWTYTDGTTEVGYSVAKMGVSGQDGKDGIPGKDGLGIKNTVIEYAQSTSGTVSPTTGWSEQVPTLVKGQYLWTQTTWTYTDNSTEKGYSVSYNAKDGNTGSDGKPGKDGNGIVKTDIQYVGSATGTTPPTSGWTAAIPTVPEGSYLWTKTTWTYTDATTEVGYSVAKMGSKGTPGATGENGKTSYIHTAYSWSSDGTDRFTTEYPKENLWVVKDLVPGYINSTTGEVVPPGATLNERATEFLKIGNNKKITVNYTVNLPINGYYWCGIGCYDADKAFISRTGFSGTPATEPGEQNKTQTFSLNPKTEYIRVSFRTYDSSVIKVEESDHLTIYTPSPVDDYDNAYPKFSGTYTDYTEIDSEDPAKYTWSRFLGEIGPDGKTTYFHQAWANSEDGKDSFSTTQSIGKKYIGTYSDQEETSSQDPTKYQWTELVGAIEHDNRNLLVGTKEFSSTYFVNNNATLTSDYYQGARIYKTTVDWGAYRYRIRDLLSREQMGIGQTYCYSCWVKYVPDTTTPNNTIYLGIYGIQEAQENGELIGEVSGKDGWVRIQVPFTLKALPSETGILRIEPSNITEKKGTLYVCGPKLEKGRWPTDWCEAPEDIEQKVESIESTIDTIDKDIETVQNGLSNLAAKASIDVGMKVGYSDFNTANATSIFFCGYKKDPSTFDETLANIDGSIRNWENNTLITVPKQQLNLSGITNKTGYIVYDHTKKLIWFVDYTTDEKWIQYNVGQTGTGTTMTFTESHYVLGEIEI